MMTNPLYLALAVFAIINLVAFFYIGSDKQRSRDHDPRIKEVNFFVWAIFFGSLGVLLGMVFFHHKTKKFAFIFGISILLLQQLTLIYLLINKLI
jgi:uncharacterized membrane protein YsdA (DUF1294 family)